MIQWIQSMKTAKTLTKAIEDKEVKKVDWEGNEYDAETLRTQSTTKIEDDKGVGAPFILRFFQFAANPETFKYQRPTAQELFNHHRKGIESMLWTDGMRPYEGIEPKLIFSKDKKTYQFAITCTPSEALIDTTRTLSQLLTNTP